MREAGGLVLKTHATRREWTYVSPPRPHEIFELVLRARFCLCVDGVLVFQTERGVLVVVVYWWEGVVKTDQ